MVFCALYLRRGLSWQYGVKDSTVTIVRVDVDVYNRPCGTVPPVHIISVNGLQCCFGHPDGTETHRNSLTNGITNMLTATEATTQKPQHDREATTQMYMIAMDIGAAMQCEDTQVLGDQERTELLQWEMYYTQEMLAAIAAGLFRSNYFVFKDVHANISCLTVFH